MTTRQARDRRRRDNLAILLGSLAAVAALVAALGPLVPPALPLPTAAARPTVATCDQPQPLAVPVPVTSGVVHGCPEVFDGRLVVVIGEAIGDLLRGPAGRRWLQVNDDAYADVGPLTSHRRTLGTNSGVAVLLPPGVTPGVLGGPRRQGDRLEVVGTFRAAAAEDQGGPAVIARTVRVLQDGSVLPAPRSPRLWVAAGGAVITAAALCAAAWRRRTPRWTSQPPARR